MTSAMYGIDGAMLVICETTTDGHMRLHYARAYQEATAPVTLYDAAGLVVVRLMPGAALTWRQPVTIIPPLSTIPLSNGSDGQSLKPNHDNCDVRYGCGRTGCPCNPDAESGPEPDPTWYMTRTIRCGEA